MMRALLVVSLVSLCAAEIPDWDSYKLADLCGGACPSTPGSTGLPQYGQKLFPALTSDAAGHLYMISATFGGAYLDNPQLISLSSSGNFRWNLTDKLADGPQESYSLRVIGEELFVQSTSCCSDGAYKSHIAKMSLNGTALWNVDLEGTPQIGPDGVIYSIATPGTRHGSFVYAMSQDGTVLWNYTDGKTMFKYLEIGGPSSAYALCMPAQHGSNGTVVCLDGSGNLAHTELVTNDRLIHFDLLALQGRYFVRRQRDNSYHMKGTNVLYEMGAAGPSVDFPDDINFLGPIAHMSDGTIVVFTRPDCPSSSGTGCRPDSLVALTVDLQPRWNATLPGDGDVTVKPAYPPHFGPYTSSGMAFASTVKRLQSDNATFDMWYAALTQEGELAWKLPVANVQGRTRITYHTNGAGDFHVLFDGVLYRVPAVQSTYV